MKVSSIIICSLLISIAGYSCKNTAKSGTNESIQQNMISDRLGENYECQINGTGEFNLCKQVIKNPGDPNSTVLFIVVKTETNEIVWESRTNSNVTWVDDYVVKVSQIKGIATLENEGFDERFYDVQKSQFIEKSNKNQK
jgi:beta-galactosidase GanA